MTALDPIVARVHVTSPVVVSGSADVFEAQFSVDVTQDGKVMRTDQIVASAGTGTRGTWKHTIDLPPGKYVLVFYATSMKDGSHVDEVRVPVWVVRTAPPQG